MRIALVFARAARGYGGIEQVVMKIAACMAEREQEVEVLIQSPVVRRASHQHANGVMVRTFPAAAGSISMPASLPLAAYLCRHHRRYQLIHAHNYHALPALLTALARPQRFVFSPHYHGTGHSALRRAAHGPYRLIGRWLFSRADAVICVSEAEQRLVTAHFSLGTTPVHLVRHGIAVEEIRGATPRSLPWPLVISVGRLERYKQTSTLLEAFALLGPQSMLAIVGDGPERPALERRCTALALRSRVIFLGVLPEADFHRWLRSATLLVSLSRHEAFGLAALEALAAGAAVVLSDIPAHREHAQRAQPGMTELVPVAAPPACVAEAMRRAVRRRLARGPGIAEHLPTWEAAVNATLRIYEDLLR